MNSILSTAIVAFATKVSSVPCQAETVTVSTYLQPAYTDAVIVALTNYGATATRGANIQGDLAADMKQVAMKSSYVG